ncbi:hypothetical protein FJY84_06995 [Candidatus Bathyarchaeota archaeon]|nr:hypothetical protein [Candidatus Bathyarchaeota archaeon]
MDAGIAKWKGQCQLRFITLTTSNEAKQLKINDSYEVLKKRIKRNFKSHFNYIKVKTEEGNGVIHLIYAGPYISQAWLSRNWDEIHGSPIVDIRKLRFGRGLRNYLSSYLQNQGRLSYSWNWFKKGWATAYKTIQLNKKRPFTLVGSFGLNPPIFCRKAWSRYFYKEVDPKLFEKFIIDYFKEESLNNKTVKKEELLDFKKLVKQKYPEGIP